MPKKKLDADGNPVLDEDGNEVLEDEPTAGAEGGGGGDLKIALARARDTIKNLRDELSDAESSRQTAEKRLQKQSEKVARLEGENRDLARYKDEAQAIRYVLPEITGAIDTDLILPAVLAEVGGETDPAAIRDRVAAYKAAKPHLFSEAPASGDGGDEGTPPPATGGGHGDGGDGGTGGGDEDEGSSDWVTQMLQARAGH